MFDFKEFELGRENDIMIEFPTKTDFGLIIMTADNKTAQSGWFKVHKIGRKVQSVKEGQEAYIFFYNQPVIFEGMHLSSRAEQKKVMDEEKEKAEKNSSKIIQVKPTWEGAPKDEMVDDRLFAVVNAHDVILTRDFVNV